MSPPSGLTPQAGDAVLERRLRDLQKVTDAALAHLTLDDLLEELLGRIVEVVGTDTAAILMLDERRQELVARAARGLEEEVERGVRIPLGRGFAGRVAAERRAIAIPELEHAEVLNPLLREKGVRSLLGVPLLVEGQVIGVLHVGTLTPREFSDEDASLLRLVAERAALAIEHARLYEREHRIAESLQRSLLPDRLPEIPGTAVAARYVPARRETEVGGDWYDVIPLKECLVGVAIGDVAGHGLPAAALMGQLRSALRAYALEGHSPSAVVERLNRLMRRLGDKRMATVLYAIFDVEAGALRFANAGHLPPLLVEADGVAAFIEQARAEPLGVLDYARYAEEEVALGDGATLVLCTDGLVERRSEALDEGLARLRDTVLDGPQAPEALCDHVLAAAVPREGGDDDVALLVLQPAVLGAEGLRLRLAADPDELARLRRLLGRWLRTVEAGPEEAYDITVACTEACANAVEHAYSPGDASFELAAALDDGEVAITVRDSGRWRPARGVNRGRGLQIMESLMDRAEVTRGEKGTTVELRRRLAGKAAT
ncbi:MAG: SpoIIE family protein phosphatase [Actinomycetota bacterium]|nr:SpoIIE family protein phosphatase [Actinomycetota bacterium]